MNIVIDDLVIGYDKPLTKPIDLSLAIGESVALIGQSGVGKTTLLNTILGMLKPLSGSVVINDVDIHKLSYKELARVRGENIGTVFQNGELLSSYTALQNVMMPRLLINAKDENVNKEALELLDKVGVSPQTRADNLSGGERQRVALARALINKPQLILADEPTGALDYETRDEMIKLLFETDVLKNTALIIVTHDPEIARVPNRVYELLRV